MPSLARNRRSNIAAFCSFGHATHSPHPGHLPARHLPVRIRSFATKGHRERKGNLLRVLRALAVIVAPKPRVGSRFRRAWWRQFHGDPIPNRTGWAHAGTGQKNRWQKDRITESWMPRRAWWSFAPKGQRHTSPGHRPGKAMENRFPSPEGAAQTTDGHVVLPFQGDGICFPKTPGRCPGLICSGPCGANDQSPNNDPRSAPGGHWHCSAACFCSNPSV